MSTTQAQKIVLAARPLGKPRLADFRLEETTIPAPGPGKVLLRVQYLSLDPYMRGRMDDRESYAPPTPVGGVMPGESVATVIATRHPGYSKGDTVLAGTGWCTHTLSDRGDLRKLDPAVAPVTTGLGVLGMPGFTAYGGLRVIGKPAPGETVVVAVYYENVGGAVWQAVLPLLNEFARVPVSGLIAHYNASGLDDSPNLLPATMRAILSKSIMVRGFINYEFDAAHFAPFLREVGAGIADGRIRYREDFVDGLEKAPEAFIGMLEGRNFGKLIVRVDNPLE